jgi:hypothetical protein
MNPYTNEDLMWERLKDMQREMENRRLYGPGRNPTVGELAALLGKRIWWIAGLATRRPPRRHPVQRIEKAESARDVA